MAKYNEVVKIHPNIGIITYISDKSGLNIQILSNSPSMICGYTKNKEIKFVEIESLDNKWKVFVDKII